MKNKRSLERKSGPVNSVLFGDFQQVKGVFTIYVKKFPSFSLIFWYQKIYFVILRKKKMISRIWISDLKKILSIFWYQKMIAWNQIIDFLKSENDFLIKEHRFLISENNCYFFISKTRISNIKKSFSDIKIVFLT